MRGRSTKLNFDLSILTVVLVVVVLVLTIVLVYKQSEGFEGGDVGEDVEKAEAHSASDRDNIFAAVR